jgi:hypothetical protein
MTALNTGRTIERAEGGRPAAFTNIFGTSDHTDRDATTHQVDRSADLEVLIAEARTTLCRATSRGSQQEAWDTMRTRIMSRSPEQVAKMERALGLR